MHDPGNGPENIRIARKIRSVREIADFDDDGFMKSNVQFAVVEKGSRQRIRQRIACGSSFVNATAARSSFTRLRLRVCFAGRSCKAASRCVRMCGFLQPWMKQLAAGFAPACDAVRPRLRRAILWSRIRTHIERNIDRAVSLAELGRIAGMSPFTVQRQFKERMGVSPLQYQRSLRAGRLRTH